MTETQVQQQAKPAESARCGAWYRPNVDIVERENELMLVADMPGVDRNGLDVHFEDGELTIFAPAPSRGPSAGAYLMHEYGVGDFRRKFRISEHVDASQIHAEYVDGVLMVNLPKVEALKPRKIEVKVG